MTPPSDILSRYQHISAFCQNYQKQVSALVPIYFVDNAIEVNFYDRQGGNNSYTITKTETLPFVRMPFIEGLPLGSFVKINHNNQGVMINLCDAWLKMIYEMEKAHIAHGDLDLTNIIVKQDTAGITLKLIDYDNAWVPALNGHPQTEVGHEHFQLPAFQNKHTRAFDANMDRFSALTIYLPLKMIAKYPSLYTNKEWGADDTHHLLFTRADYVAEMQGTPNHISLIRAADNAELNPLLDELSGSLREKRVPRSLSELITGKSYNWDPGTSDDINSPPPDASGSNEQEEFEQAYFEWDKIRRLSEQGNLPGPALSETIPTSQPSPVNPWDPTEPASTLSEQRQTQVMSPLTRTTAQYQQNNTMRIILFLLLIAVIIAIIVVVLWFTNVIPHTPAHTTGMPGSVVAATHSFLAHVGIW